MLLLARLFVSPVDRPPTFRRRPPDARLPDAARFRVAALRLLPELLAMITIPFALRSVNTSCEYVKPQRRYFASILHLFTDAPPCYPLDAVIPSAKLCSPSRIHAQRAQRTPETRQPFF